MSNLHWMAEDAALQVPECDTLNGFALSRSPFCEVAQEFKDAVGRAHAEIAVLKTQVRSGLKLAALSSERANKAEARIEELEKLVPAPGDGSCDRCGRVPSVHIPTSLCDECLDLLGSDEK